MSFLSPCNFFSRCYDFFCCRSRAAASNQPRPTAASRLAGTQAVLALVTNNRDMLADELEVTLQQAQAASRAAIDALIALEDLRLERQLDQRQIRVLSRQVEALENRLELAQTRRLQEAAVQSVEELQPLIPAPEPLPPRILDTIRIYPRSSPDPRIQDDPYPRRRVPSVTQPSSEAPRYNEPLDEVEQLKLATERELRQRKKKHEAKENWYRKNPPGSSS